MLSSLVRILEKPVCQFIETAHPVIVRFIENPVGTVHNGCKSICDKLRVTVPTLFDPTSPEYLFLEARYHIKKNIKESSKPLLPRAPQRGIMRGPVIWPTQKALLRCVMDGIDFVYRYSEKSTTMAVGLVKGLNNLYQNAYPLLSEHECLFTPEDLSDSLIGIRKVGTNNEPLPLRAQEEDVGPQEVVTEVEQPSFKAQQEDPVGQENITKVDQPPTHYGHPKTDKEEVDDFILISTDYEDDDYIFLY